MQTGNQNPSGKLLNGSFTFFQEFLKHPLRIASVVPSSRFLERRIVETAGIHGANTVVELGPGIGGTTRAILQAMPTEARLLSIELNPHLWALVSRIDDSRLTAHLGNAGDLKAIMSSLGVEAPDVIISGIPFVTMSREAVSSLLETITSVLAPGGRFVAYQVSSKIVSQRRSFQTPGELEVELVLLNIPPLRLLRWEKPIAEAGNGLSAGERFAAPPTV
jgi:phospholipid N-methyltransferase